MRINNNIMALNANRQLGINNTGTAKSLEKLSSGFRINRAGDDAAGLAISEKMRGQIRGLNQASRNAQDGISLIQTAEGALNETHAILQRMRELAVQSSTDTNTDADRVEIQKEVDQLATEITRISETTQFNTMNLLDGTYADKKFHIGANQAQNTTIKIENMSANALEVAGPTGASFEITGTKGDAGLAEGTYEVIALDEDTKVGTDIQKYALLDKDGKVYAVSKEGKDYNLLTSPVALEKIGLAEIEATSAGSVKFADTVISGKVEINGEGAGTAKATVNDDDMKLSNGTYTVSSDGFTLTDENGKVVATSTDKKEFKDVTDPTVTILKTATELKNQEIEVGSNGGLNVSTQKSADKAITIINDAITTVSSERSKLGAMQNRLEHTIKNLDTSAENLQASESRIRDVDMAKEMMEFTKQNILQQAATAMLAQANQAPQTVLQLLR